MTDPSPTVDDERASLPTLGPVVAIARSEIRSRWVSLVLIGLLAGLVGAVSVSGIALARRTTTAYDRLGKATRVDDARGFVTGYPELVDDLTTLPAVTARWVGGIGVAQVEEEHTFVGIVAGPREPSPLFHPIVLEGRLPGASSDPQVIEIALRDDFQRQFHLPMGQEVPVRFLTQADYYRFDTGFEGGDVHGREAVLRVVGTVRMAGAYSDVPPAFASSAALDSHPDAFIGAAYFVRLAGGADAVADFTRAADEVVGDRTLPPEGQEFEIIGVSDTSVNRASVDNTALLLGRALMAFALSTAIVGGFAVVQSLSRHHTATARAREVEQALGLTRGQQAGARVLSGLVPAVLATTVAAVGALAASSIEPIGALNLYEPHPGAVVNVTVLAVGVASVFAGVLGAAVLTGTLQRARHVDTMVRESKVVGRVSRVGGSPSTVLGLRFALEPGRGARAVPVRSAIVGAMVGVAGVVAGLVYISSLDRLVSSPTRSAIPFDVLVADVTAEDLQGDVLDDPRVGDVTVIETAPLSFDGRTVDGHALQDLRGSLDIGLEEGRLPQTPDEIALGLRMARDLGVHRGDTVTVTRPGGDERDLAVVGIAVIPAFNTEELGLNAMMTTEGLEANASALPFTEAAVSAAPGEDVSELNAFLASQFEADVSSAPVTVKNLEELGGLPGGVAAIVGSIAVLALANALVVAVRRRGRDLSVMRAIGFSRRQTAVAVLVMALAIVAIGVVIGVPVGMAIGATLWRATASGAFVLSDAYFRWEVLLLPVVGAVVIALVAAAIPARQAAAQRAADGLRAE
ncbi:MAG: ABC transporter permease [Acidimicrobiales bacterium]